MRIAVIADVHANLAALEAVLAEIDRRGVDRICFAGDAVGYGPDPEACVALIKERTGPGVAGNHDWGLIGKTPTVDFNFMAVDVLDWTRQQCIDEVRPMLDALPLTVEVPEAGLLLAHASPHEPARWRYATGEGEVALAFRATGSPVTVIGHSHVPFVAEMMEDGNIFFHGGFVGVKERKPGLRYLVNAGAVGQPRDQNPRAACAFIDEHAIEIVRVEYDVDHTVARLKERGLHLALGERLRYGF
jgi:diadenosine tetraphosphatase ApaH/serine/threonine PP2A family protein phosphatase